MIDNDMTWHNLNKEKKSNIKFMQIEQLSLRAFERGKKLLLNNLNMLK